MKNLLLAAGAALFAIGARGGESRLVALDDCHRIENRALQGIPSLEISRANGRRWAVWYAGPVAGEDSNNYVVLATSEGPGRPWREVGAIDPDGEGPVRAFDPELWIAPDGKLRVFWTERRVTPRIRHHDPYLLSGIDTAEDRLMMLELSAEDEPALPSAEARQIGTGVMMCKPIVLKSGAWQLPVAVWWKETSARFVLTKDGGRTFKLAEDDVCTGTVLGASVPEGDRTCDEHVAVQFPDGSRKCWIRTRSGVRTATSAGENYTWTDAVKEKGFRHTDSRMWVSALASGNLVCVKHGRPDENVGRTNLTAYVSRDRGATWEGGLLLDARFNAAYPDGVQLKDGTITVIYDRDRTGAGEVLLATFTEADVLAGRDVSGKVALRETVSAHPATPGKGMEGIDARTGHPLDWDNRTVWRDAREVGIDGAYRVPGTKEFTRLPLAAKGRVTGRVWGWSRQATGMGVRFRTDSKTIRFRWGVGDDAGYPGGAPKGLNARGIDVYGRKEGRPWEYIRSFNTASDGTGHAELKWSSEWEARVYLPPRAHLENFQIGTDRGTKLEKGRPLAFGEKPIVHYGTSIVHGGCVARPGMIYTSHYGRLLDAEVVNMGFSGSAEMEPEMIEYVAAPEAALYILDPLPNMWTEIVEERYEKFVRGVKARRPETPILLCSAYRSGQPGADTRDGLWVKKLWERLRKEDPATWANLHYLPAKDMLPPDSWDATLDKTHPNEYGSQHLAKCYAAKIREIFAKEK